MTTASPSSSSPAAKLKIKVTLDELKSAGALDANVFPRILKRVVGMTLRYPLDLSMALGAAVGAAVFSLILPRLLGRAVDQAHSLLAKGAAEADVRHALLVTAGLVIGVSALRGVLQMAAGFAGEKVGQKVGYDLRVAFFEKLQRLGFDYHDRNHSGDLITRGMLDLEGVRGFIENGMQRIVSLALLLGLGAWLLVGRDPLLAVLAFSFVPFVAFRAVRTGLFLRLTWTRLQQKMSLLTRTMEENLQGMRVVRAFAAKAFEMGRFDESAGEALRLANHRIVIRTSNIASMTFAYYVAMGLVLWVGGHRVQAGRMSIGQLTEFLTFMTILQQPVRQIMMIVNSSARAASSGQRLFEVLDLPIAIADRVDAPSLALSSGVLKFDDVSFAYDPAGPNALSNISFEVGSGQTLGVVGPPGSGKSTLAHLIPRFYDVSSGAVRIDGQDVRAVTLASLRQTVGLVAQDVFLFDDSLADNIAYAAPGARRAHLQASAGIAQLHDHIASLPASYETRIGERGVSLSGGQRQRLSIARGITPEPQILVFDDATSAVDAATEHRLRAALQAATRDKTNVIISHRLASVMHADEILVLDAGRVVERGTHAALLRHGGLYADLYELQSRQASPEQALEKSA